MANYPNNAANNSQWQDINVKTNSIVLFNNDGDRLKVSFYDDTISIEIVNPFTDESGKKHYTAEKQAKVGKVTLILERVFLLNKLCDNWVISMAAKTKYSGSMFTNKDNNNMLQLFTSADGIPTVYIHTGFDEECHPKASTSFTFKTIQYIENYDASTGKYDDVKVEYAQVYILIQAIRCFAENSGMGAGHFNRVADKYTSRRIMNQISSIAQKLGVPSSTFGSSNGYATSQPGGQFNMGMTSTPVSIETTDDLSSLLN